MTKAAARFGLLAMALTGCDHKAGAMHDSGAHHTTSGDGADGASGADGAAALGCSGVGSGRATATGSCFGMEMQADLTVDAETCAYTLGAWNMDHGDMPTGGEITDGQATLVGGGLEGCLGEAADGHLEGLCADGCAWSLDVR